MTDLEHLQTYLPLTEDSARRLLDEVAALTQSADPRWIRPVLMMLDEHCPLEGVMQRLLEHLEVMAADDLARGLVDVLPVIVRRSPYWATQAVRRLLWERTHTDALIRALRDSDGPQRDAMAGVLDGITTRGLQGAVGAIRESLRAG